MKKLLAISLCALFCMVCLVGCSSVVVPTSSVRWEDGETLIYDVRRASDYELAYIGMYSMQKTDNGYTFVNGFEQQIPSEVVGTYTTAANLGEQPNTWKLSSTLAVRETYLKNDFSDDTLYAAAVEKANASADDFVEMQDDDIVVDVKIESVCVVNSAGMLPVSSSKTVQSIFIGCGICAVNDFTTTVEYDYSAKRPVAKCTTDASGQKIEVETKLKKSASTKTYDNEELSFLMRSFSLDTLVSNASTALTVFDGTNSQDTVTLTLGVTKSNYEMDYKVGGVWNSVDDNANITYYMDGENYTDAKGNVVTVVDRKVALVFAQTEGLPMFFYLDNQNRDGANYKETIIRMQQSYMIFDIQKDFLLTL